MGSSGWKNLAIVVGSLSKKWIIFLNSRSVGLFVKQINKIENKKKRPMSRPA